MKHKNLTIQNELTEFLLYTTPNSDIKIEAYLHNETVWLPQKRIAELFGVQRPAITKHLKNIFESGELEESAVSSILEHTAEDGKTYQTKFYNLDAIKFLEFNEYEILPNNGTISRTQAMKKAYEEYEAFNKTQKIESDFDKEIVKLLAKNKNSSKA